MGIFRRRRKWKKQGDIYTWNGHEWGVQPVPQQAAYQYYDFKLLAQGVGERRFRRSLEVGCGWGGRTPWIAEFSDEAHAIEPNPEVLAEARDLYPAIIFSEASAQAIPYADGYFDLVVTWTVLQHIPPEHIAAAASEITRVLAADGLLVLCESLLAKRSRPPVWYRRQEGYEALFDSLSLKQCIPLAPISGRPETDALLCFERTSLDYS